MSDEFIELQLTWHEARQLTAAANHMRKRRERDMLKRNFVPEPGRANVDALMVATLTVVIAKLEAGMQVLKADIRKRAKARREGDPTHD